MKSIFFHIQSKLLWYINIKDDTEIDVDGILKRRIFHYKKYDQKSKEYEFGSFRLSNGTLEFDMEDPVLTRFVKHSNHFYSAKSDTFYLMDGHYKSDDYGIYSDDKVITWKTKGIVNKTAEQRHCAGIHEIWVDQVIAEYRFIRSYEIICIVFGFVMIVIDSKGVIYCVDTNSNKMEKWSKKLPDITNNSIGMIVYDDRKFDIYAFYGNRNMYQIVNVLDIVSCEMMKDWIVRSYLREIAIAYTLNLYDVIVNIVIKYVS